jgi:N-acetylglucosaminyl-diphospho-decaprenol L-rhamnosyltransferase
LSADPAPTTGSSVVLNDVQAEPHARCIDVVIVNWNAADHLAACLASLAVDPERTCIRTVAVVDNGSTDDSLAGPFPAALPTVVDRAGSNLGFAAGANRGARPGTAPYILFLNPDTRLVPGALDAALSAFDRSADIGIVGVRLLDQAGKTSRTCSRFPTAGAFAARSLGLDRLPGCHRLKPFMEDWSHDESRMVDQVMGAFMMIPRELYQKLGGFDERFFLYYEDVDLARRAKLAGRTTWFEAGGAAYHVGGGSSSAIPGRRLCHILSSRLAYAHKNLSRSGFLLVILMTVMFEPGSRLVRELCCGSLRGAAAVTTGFGLLLWRKVVRK